MIGRGLLKKYALVLCAVLLALGVSVAATAQDARASAAGTSGALGNASAVDETTLAIEGETGAGAKAGAKAAGPNTFLYFIRMVVVLALVLGAIYLVFRLMKSLGKPKIGSDSAIKVLATTSLGTGRAVHVINIGSKAYLIGATDSSVSLIAEIAEKEVVDELVLKAGTEKAAPTGDFAAILSSLLPRKKGGAAKISERDKARAARDQDGLGPEFLAIQRERLKKF
jgi:flagellar protein FliO/FliZ